MVSDSLRCQMNMDSGEIHSAQIFSSVQAPFKIIYSYSNYLDFRLMFRFVWIESNSVYHLNLPLYSKLHFTEPPLSNKIHNSMISYRIS